MASTPATERLDARGVRALTHPLRVRLLDLLRFDGPSTATLLARRVGESSGSTSYHLRQLERYGFIQELQREGGRERWWGYRERMISIADGGGSRRQLIAELLSSETQALDDFLAEPPHAEWDDASFFHSTALHLTARELDSLRCGIEALIAPLRTADAANRSPEALPVRVLTFGFPMARRGE